MKEFLELLVDPALIGMNVFIVLAISMVWLLLPKDEPRSTKVMRGVWAATLALFAIWIFQQEHHVRLGSIIPTASTPTAVSFKGSTRYVSASQAFLYEYGFLFLLVAGLLCAGIERLMRGKRDEA